MTRQLNSTDTELGIAAEPSNTPSETSRTRTWRYLRGLRSWCISLFGNSTQDNRDGDLQGFQIEDYPKGYPRFSALIAAHDSFQILRRFSNLRARLLLLSQDEVAQLEKKLDKIDREESSPLFLGSSRRDKNEERKSVIDDLRGALKTYDELIERCFRNLAFGAAHPRDVSSLRNWHMANACISREEMEFLGRPDDLLCLSAPGDGLVSWLERYVSEKLLLLSKKCRSDVSRDQHVHIYSRDCASLLARIISTPLIIILVLVPVIICNAVNSLNSRLAIIVIATSIFLTFLSLLMKVKMLELVVAGAT
ncbi:hypothetical protein BDZ45DRAFT_665461 [Acephala macrosclerotiorum]|nr:hypothetical protein BDZ45DRAFT_665461 [Acephala macrosclerotiorum]